MTTVPASYQLFVGIDIAARTAAVSWMIPDGSPTRALTIEQTPAGFAVLRERLLATGIPLAQMLIVMEATGSYWVQLATWLVEAGCSVSVANPAKAHHFAQGLGQRAKTDAIDAQTLAQLAAQQHPKPWTPPPAIYTTLQHCLAQRERFLQARGQAQNQLHAWQQLPRFAPAVRERQEALIAYLTAQVVAIEADIAEAFKQEPAWEQSLTWLPSIRGIGLLTAAWLIVTTLNFTLCPDAAHAASYAGLAPMPYKSGTSVHKRPNIGHAGNPALRRALYLATLSAARYCPPVKACYDRLRAAGKPMKVARCAAARKLLHLAFALVKKGQFFDPCYQQNTRAFQF